MTTEKHLALELVAVLADRFGPGSKVAKEVPGWIEYLTDVECPNGREPGQGRPGGGEYAVFWRSCVAVMIHARKTSSGSTRRASGSTSA